jgi:probable rRNA maturation factor
VSDTIDLEHAFTHRAELSLVFVGEKRIRQLKNAFFGQDRVTDVIAFDMRDNTVFDPETPLEDDEPDGEIVVCPAVAYKRANSYDNVFAEELLLYIVHGMLHLCGWRDGTPQEADTMAVKQQEVMTTATAGMAIDRLFTWQKTVECNYKNS